MASTSTLVDRKGKAKESLPHHPRMPFVTSLIALEAAGPRGPPPAAANSVLRRLDALKRPHDPFPRDAATKALVKSGTVELSDGVRERLSPAEEEVVDQVAARFQLDDVEALMAIRALDKGKVEKLVEEDWDTITASVFEERMAVLGIVTLLLRANDEPEHPCYDLAVQVFPSIFTPELVPSLLGSFVRRTSQPLPDTIRSTPVHALFWAKQLIREQKAILDLVFLIYYYDSPDAPGVVGLLDAIAATKWGQRQESFGYFDSETKSVVREIGDLLSLLAIESLDLDLAVATDHPVPAPVEAGLAPTSVYHPVQLQAISDAIETLVQSDGPRAAPVLLGWAYVLSRVTASLLERGVPDSYKTIATATLRIENAQPLFQAYAAHALAPSSALFATLLALVTSPLFGSPHAAESDPNAFGYASVLRTLLTSLPLLVRLTFLTAEQYAGFVDTFAALFSTSAGGALATHFWQAYNALSYNEPVSVLDLGEREIVDLARSRFPVQFGPFLKIARGLADVPAAAILSHDDGREEAAPNDVEAQTSAAETSSYLAALTTLTHVVQTPLGVPPAYEECGYIGDIPRYRCTRAITVSKGVVVPIGTLGTLVSERSRKPVAISWDLQWSAWKLFADVLEDAAMMPRKLKAASGDVFGSASADDVAPLPIDWASDAERAQDVTTIVEIFRTVVTNHPGFARELIDHIEEDKPESYQFIDVVSRLLERSLAQQPATPSQLVSSLLGLVSQLLTTKPGAIWTFLRGSTVLFPAPAAARWGQDPSRNAILQAERDAGTYPVTLSLLSLVHLLVLEEQISSCAVTDPTFAALKQGVLVRALTWVRDEIWTAHGSWRFTDLAEKYELAKRIVNLYRLVLEAGELSPGAAQGKFDPVVSVVVDALLVNATASQLAPLISTIVAGPEPIHLLRKALRYADARAAEQLVEATLALTLKLIRLRRRRTGTTSSLLENTCLVHGLAPAGRRDPVAALGAFVTSSGVSNLASMAAARVLTLLCVGSSEWQPRPPSFVQLLGGSSKVEKFVVAILLVVEDVLRKEDLHVAVWDLISAVVETQPSLAMLLVTGRHYPFGPDSASATPEAGVVLPPSLLPPTFPSLDRTAVGVALEAVGTWSDAWRERPTVLTAVLRFLDYTWQHLVDYGAALEQFRKNENLWEKLVAIAFESAEDDQSADEAAYCHRMMAKASAVRILALDIQAALLRPGVDKAVSVTSLLKTFAIRTASTNPLTDAVSVAFKSDWAPELHDKLLAQIHGAHESIHMNELRVPRSTHPLDDADARPFGEGYYYSLQMLRRKLDGFGPSNPSGPADSDGDVDFSDDEEPGEFSVIDAAARLSNNYSLLEAQISNTRAWRQLFEIVLPLLRKNVPAAGNTVNASTVAATTIAEETRGGQIMIAVHEERLSILQTMVEVLHVIPSKTPKITKALAHILTQLARTFASEALPPLESVLRRTPPAFHRTLFSTTYVAFHKLNGYSGAELADITLAHSVELGVATDAILRVMITATRDLLVLAKAKKDLDLENDLVLAISVVNKVIQSPFAPSAAKWVAYCRNVDLFRSALEVFVHMEELDGRPLYAQHILDLCLSMATVSPVAAEAMALEGLMVALSNNALSAKAEAGAIEVVSRETNERTYEHELWTSMLALVVALTRALGGEGMLFVEQEVVGFVRLYGPQISRALRWQAETTLTLPAIEEYQNVVALVHGVVRSAGPQSIVSTQLVPQAVLLLQQLNAALTYPNKLAGCINAVTTEERVLMDKDVEGSPETDPIPLEQRPVLARVTLAFMQIAGVIVDMLVNYTEALRTLTRDEVEWRIDRAIIHPIVGLKKDVDASIGTLFDLAYVCIGLVRPTPPPALDTAAAAAPASPPFIPTPLLPYTPALLARNSSQTLEGILLLATTQLALWLYRYNGPSDQDNRQRITRNLAPDLVVVLDSTQYVH
ncbi:hypothetical protein RQP46_010972 [Phenoliferia psychrophenolica]